MINRMIRRRVDEAGRSLQRCRRSYRDRIRRRRRRHVTVAAAATGDDLAAAGVDASQVFVFAEAADEMTNRQNAPVLDMVFQRHPKQ